MGAARARADPSVEGEYRPDLPLCAIGGITPERAPGVVAAGADSVAVITDFFTHPTPEARVQQWIAWARSTPQGI